MSISKINLYGKGASATVSFTYTPDVGPLFGRIDVTGDPELVRELHFLLSMPQPILPYMTYPYPVETSYYQAYAAARCVANERGLSFEADSPPPYPRKTPVAKMGRPPLIGKVKLPDVFEPYSRAANPRQPMTERSSERYRKSLVYGSREPNGRFVYTKGGAKSPTFARGPHFMQLLADALGIAYTESAMRRYPTDLSGLFAALSALRTIFINIVLVRGLSATARRGRDKIAMIRLNNYASAFELYKELKDSLPSILLCDKGYDVEYIRECGEHFIKALSLLLVPGPGVSRSLPEGTVLSPDILRKIASEIAMSARAARNTDATDAIEPIIDLYN